MKLPRIVKPARKQVRSPEHEVYSALNRKGELTQGDLLTLTNLPPKTVSFVLKTGLASGVLVTEPLPDGTRAWRMAA